MVYIHSCPCARWKFTNTKSQTHTQAHLHMFIYKHTNIQVTNICIIPDTHVLECMHKRAHMFMLK